jgi:pyrroline-5-carboxylate reductase
MNATVFIGSGRIASALLAGLRLAEYKPPIVVHSRNTETLKGLKKRYGVAIETDLRQAVSQASLLIIAVPPASVTPLLKEISPIKRSLTVISLAAGIPFAKLGTSLGPPVNWARAMPSPACRTGHGLTGLAFERDFPAAARREVTKLFSSVGTIIEVPEPKFDAFTVTYSCSHGYHALAVLAAAGQKLGLDRKTSLQAAAHALADGIISWREGQASLGDMLIEATTPGGIAAATMSAIDRAGYARAVEKGLAAGLKRAEKNSANA